MTADDDFEHIEEYHDKLFEFVQMLSEAYKAFSDEWWIYELEAEGDAEGPMSLENAFGIFRRRERNITRNTRNWGATAPRSQREATFQAVQAPPRGYSMVRSLVPPLHLCFQPPANKPRRCCNGVDLLSFPPSSSGRTWP